MRQTALQTVVRPKSGRPRCLRAAWLRQAFWHPLHADVFIAAHDRAALERICRYMARPPIPQDRLSWRSGGKLVRSLKRTWKGGIEAVVFEPLALIARLAALVPRSVHASAQILRDFRTEPWVARTHRPDSARPREHHGTRSSRTAEEHALGAPAHAQELRP